MYKTLVMERERFVSSIHDVETFLPVGVQGELVSQFSELFLSDKEQFS